jgi:hypothetical protein
MSYVGCCGLGTVDVWEYVWALHSVSATDVMVLRLQVANARLDDPSDALLFVRAAGQGQNWGMDVRGVAVSAIAGSADKQVDIVFTKGDAGFLGFGPIVGLHDDAAAMAKQIATDEVLRQVSPNITISAAAIGPLTGPADALDHWRSQPIVWDHLLSGPKGRGGPTDTFAQPADYTVVKGTADDGKRAVPWKMVLYDLTLKKLKELTATEVALIVGGAALVGFVGYKVFKKET